MVSVLFLLDVIYSDFIFYLHLQLYKYISISVKMAIICQLRPQKVNMNNGEKNFNLCNSHCERILDKKEFPVVTLGRMSARHVSA